jgi:predicted AlkP superfamily phosphohydrolase/phosphomutase
VTGWPSRRAATALLLVCVGAAALLACGGSQQAQDAQDGGSASRATPLVVVGIDGAEWSVIRRQWEEGRLPALRALAEAGVATELETAYLRSPVIWTTVATGVAPWVHGIEDFVAPSPAGDVPVSSAHRRVPALWNLLSGEGRRCAVLGWWASWPAEEIDGVVISDRVLDAVEDRVWPPELEETLEQRVQAARAMQSPWAPEGAELRDRLVAHAAAELVEDGGFDLILVYFRTLDVTSHLYWRYWEPERFPPLPPQELRAYAGEVPRAYDAVDRALARIVGAAGGRFNVVVLSDHGFRAAREVETRVFLDLDAVLERLGYLERGPDGEVDLAASSLYTFATAEGTPRKKVRFGARVRGMDENGSGPEVPSSSGRRATPTELRSRLANDLDRVTYRSGAAVLALRELSPIERREGAELMLDVLSDGASEEVLVDGEPVPGAVSQISRISGTHTKTTHGIFLAAGPDIDPRADLTGIRIQDIASTLLYGLGLPVAEDSVGDARLDLYRPELRRRRPLRTVASWGSRDAEPTGPEAGDEEHLRQLRALGYLD